MQRVDILKVLSEVPEKYKSNMMYRFVRKSNRQIRWFIRNNEIEKSKKDVRYDTYAEELDTLKDKHRGERCFLICTGPSINNTDLSLLKDEVCFGVNAVYKLPVLCKYFAVADYENVWVKHKNGIFNYGCDYIFLGGAVARWYLKNNYKKAAVIPLREHSYLRESKEIVDPIQGVPKAHHVPVSVCLPLIKHMGFTETYLLGTDCTYEKEHHFYGTEDPNEMDHTKRPKYWDEVFNEYEIVKKIFENDGKKIYNTTVGGMLEVFERIKLEDVINDK